MNGSAPATRPRAGGASGALRDHLFALRPLLLIPAVALFEAGRAEGGGAWAPALRALPALLSLLALLGAVHLVNSWNDREGDRINRKGREIATGAVRGRSLAWLGAGLLLVAGLSAACPLVSPGARLVLTAALLLGAAYVVPPFEWKRRPGLDLLAQAVGYGVAAFLLGIEQSPSAGESLAKALSKSLPYAFGIATVSLVTMLADREGDAAAGQRTTAVALGPRGSVNGALGLAVATSAVGLAEGSWAPGLWGLLAIAALALFAPAVPEPGPNRGGGGEREAWNRIAIALQLAFLFLLFPRTPIPLLAAGLLGVAASAHDRSRGGQGYPLFRSGTGGGEDGKRPEAGAG